MHLVECKKGSASGVENVPVSLMHYSEMHIYIYIDLLISPFTVSS